MIEDDFNWDWFFQIIILTIYFIKEIIKFNNRIKILITLHNDHSKNYINFN